MRCPFCGNEDTQVRDSRPTEEASSIRRRRQCLACGGRFTTFERIQMRSVHYYFVYNNNTYVLDLRSLKNTFDIEFAHFEKIIFGITFN